MIEDDIKAALKGVTQWPWYFHDGGPYTHVRAQSDRVLICILSWHSSTRLHHPLKPESLANTKLIAAAPDLLTRALEEIERLQHDNSQSQEDIGRLYAEIDCAKASYEDALKDRVALANEVESLRAQRDEAMAALKALYKGYINLLESGRDKIIELGGQCDPVDRMEASSPYLREARAAIAKGAASEKKSN